ncbi:MAG: hypothetical protein L3J51_09745 [Cocleimonas sp.]|nr:hypothetical protein [Cocleimonas sp.]
MNEHKIRLLMMTLILIGVFLILTGIYFIAFTDTATTEGTTGIFKITGLIAGGLFLSVPAKIYLTLQLMKYNDEKVRAANIFPNNSANGTHTDED